VARPAARDRALATMSESDTEPYLRFRRMPLLLRILVVLLVGDGAFRLGRYFVALLGGEPTRLSQLGTGALFLAAGVQLLRGRRSGIDWIVPYNLLLFGMLAYGLWRSGEAITAKAIGTGVLLLALSGYLWWCRQRLPWQARGSYGQWMTDPDFRDGAAAWFAERDRLVAQDRRQPPDPDEVVRSLLDGADADMVRHRLQEAPQHFGMAVLRALADPAFRRDPEILAMLIDQLPDELHERARSSLVASLDHLTGFERGQVLRRLAEAGDPSLRERLLRELDGDGGKYVAEGLATAFADGRASEDVRRTFEPALRARLDQPKAPENVAVALARLDPSVPQKAIDRAMATLAGEPMSHLVAMGEAGIPLPAAAMLTLWRRLRDEPQWFWCWRLMPHVPVPEAELRALHADLPRRFDEPARGGEDPQAVRSRQQYARLAFLRTIEQLVARGCTDAEPLLEQAIAIGREDVSDRAAHQLLRLHGAPEDLTFDDATNPTPTQLALRSLAFASSYACNGGILHAFECLDAACIAAFEPALQAIAPPAVRDVWLAARRELSPTPLPTDPDERRLLVMGRYDEVKPRLDELDKQFYRCKWQLEVAMARYALAHRDELLARK
jgi:hypothetical protein